MMIKDQLVDELKQAMRARDKLRLEALRYGLSLIKNAEIDKRSELIDEEMVKILRSEVKKRKEAIEQIRGGGREELAKEEEAKVEVLQEFLPKGLSQTEVEKVVDEVMVGGMSDFGGAMKVVMGKLAGRADGAMVAAIVKRKLA